MLRSISCAASTGSSVRNPTNSLASNSVSLMTRSSEQSPSTIRDSSRYTRPHTITQDFVDARTWSDNDILAFEALHDVVSLCHVACGYEIVDALRLFGCRAKRRGRLTLVVVVGAGHQRPPFSRRARLPCPFTCSGTYAHSETRYRRSRGQRGRQLPQPRIPCR